jgi:hypothetical protein
MTTRGRPGNNGSWRSQGQSHPAKQGSDYLLDAVEDNWPLILMAYRKCEEKERIVLYDIQKKRIYVYPYAEFLGEMSEESQLTLKDQYERAIEVNKSVVFVRDNEQRRLVSFSIDYE